MSKHRYSIIVQEVPCAPDQEVTTDMPIRFEVESREDWQQILQRAKQLDALDAESVAAFVIGLKLFGGVMLDKRSHPLFAEFAPQFGQFMRQLKGKDRQQVT